VLTDVVHQQRSRFDVAGMADTVDSDADLHRRTPWFVEQIDGDPIMPHSRLARERELR
jgi:hypothetical protein